MSIGGSECIGEVTIAGAIGTERCDVPALEILDSGYAFLSIADHFTEEVGEACAAEFGRPRSVEVPIVYGFAVGGCAEARSGLGGAVGEC